MGRFPKLNVHLITCMYVVGSANFWLLSLEKKHFVHNFFKGEISESIVYLQDNVTTTKDKKSDKKVVFLTN